MVRAVVALLLVAGVMPQVDAVGTQAKMSANPIRRVVNMMSNMQKKIQAEADAKEKMFEKFMCYCSGGDEKLKASISAASEKIPQLESGIKEDGASKSQLEADVKGASGDRSEAEKTLGKAKAIREKEAKEFAATAADTKANIAALSKAIPAIQNGMSASFLQENSGAMQRLRQLSVSMEMESVDRDLLASFLSGSSSNKGSGEILGILKTMKEEMEKDLADATADENERVKDYDSLVGAKNKEKAALTKAVETKTVRIGELAVGLAEKKNDLEDTSENMAEDKTMLANLATQCATKKKEYEEFKKVTAEEQVALADTIKLLNDDEALDLFKKTLPSGSSFMQVQVTSKSTQRRALAMLKAARRGHRGDHRLDFLELALRGGKVGFDKILKMVDDLMGVLRKEQQGDDDKKSYCNAEFDKQEDVAKALKLDVSDIGKAIADGEESMKTLAKEVAALTEGIKDLDKSVAEATDTRKAENADVTKTLSANGAAKDLLGMAKKRLNKFYNPKMSFVQVQAHNDVSYKKKGEEANGVIAMIDLLIADLDKQTQTLEVEEKTAQSEYETFMGDAKKKRALDAKTITDKEGAQAEVEAELESNKVALKEKKTESMETAKLIAGLHQECDFVLKFYDARKTARTDEIEALDKAKAVLNGADYSFIQTASVHLRGSK